MKTAKLFSVGQDALGCFWTYSWNLNPVKGVSGIDVNLQRLCLAIARFLVTGFCWAGMRLAVVRVSLLIIEVPSVFEGFVDIRFLYWILVIALVGGALLLFWGMGHNVIWPSDPGNAQGANEKSQSGDWLFRRILDVHEAKLLCFTGLIPGKLPQKEKGIGNY
jgi:hypothetical protein